jgi:hypothetical protein
MALFFFLWSLSAWAQGAGEYLLGRILGLDRERGVAQVEVREGVRERMALGVWEARVVVALTVRVVREAEVVPVVLVMVMFSRVVSRMTLAPSMTAWVMVTPPRVLMRWVQPGVLRGGM